MMGPNEDHKGYCTDPNLKGMIPRMIEEISHIRRDILDFRRPLKPQSAVLKMFAEKAEKFFPQTS